MLPFVFLGRVIYFVFHGFGTLHGGYQVSKIIQARHAIVAFIPKSDELLIACACGWSHSPEYKNAGNKSTTDYLLDAYNGHIASQREQGRVA